MSNSQIFAIGCIVVIIVIGIFVGVGLSLNKNVQTNANEIKQNEIVNNVVNEVKENTIIENKIENTIENKVENTQKQNTETFTEKPKTQEEKAILMVKKDYGDRNNIEFSVEGMDGKGRQIVVVRNSNTTEALAFYFVDVDNNTFDKQ